MKRSSHIAFESVQNLLLGVAVSLFGVAILCGRVDVGWFAVGPDPALGVLLLLVGMLVGASATIRWLRRKDASRHRS